jgi:hypothetical protein
MRRHPLTPLLSAPSRRIIEMIQETKRNKNWFCIYALVHPNTGLIRYIGKTATGLNTRLNGHIAKSKRKNTPVNKWVHQLLERGIRPAIVLIKAYKRGSWGKAERYWIRHYRRTYKLLNVCDGGNGAANVKTDLLNQIESYLGKQSDVELAKQFGVCRETITYHRNKLGIPPCERDNSHNFDHLKGKPPHNKIRIPESVLCRLGTVSDAELAIEVGCSNPVIARVRNELGIPDCPQKHLRGKQHPNFGKKLSASVKKAISDSISGENHPRRKLKEDDVRHIRTLYSNGLRVVDIMKVYIYISRGAITAIISGRTWKGVK